MHVISLSNTMVTTIMNASTTMDNQVVPLQKTLTKRFQLGVSVMATALVNTQGEPQLQQHLPQQLTKILRHRLFQ